MSSRDEFRKSVFERDSSKCVLCDKPAVDAHHILDRSLFSNGGYEINNGVSLCSEHHLEAEKTSISCDELRKAAKIKTVILPEHFFQEEKYDHWGNIILSNGTRIKGELFYLSNVQKAISEHLHLFLPYLKYPRTYHVPWSEGLQDDDRKHERMIFFENREIIGTEKVDGECTTMYKDYIHARSIDSKHHKSRDWIKGFHASIASSIPEGWRICGENLYAKHSIHYKHLKSYFYVYSIWNEKNVCLSWDDTVEWCSLLNLVHVPLIYRGGYNQDAICDSFKKYFSKDEIEGYVIRISGEFNYTQFKDYTAKWVRKGHVQTNESWMNSKIIVNELENL